LIRYSFVMLICPLSPTELLNAEVELCKALYQGATNISGREMLDFQRKLRELKKFTDAPEEFPLNTVVGFEAWDYRNPKEKWWVHLCALLEQDKGERSATYAMAIRKKEDKGATEAGETLCKLHLDYQFSAKVSKEAKPERHLQIGGRMPPVLEQFGYTRNWLKSTDKPRLPSFPFCFVLLMHWGFLEFAHCDHIGRILNDPWWANLVRKAENKILKPYFEGALGFFADTKLEKKSFITHGYH
jgi:hypothetical protein